MYQVYCLNLEKNIEFMLEFEFYDSFQKFIHKCKYSKKIKVLSWSKW